MMSVWMKIALMLSTLPSAVAGPVTASVQKGSDDESQSTLLLPSILQQLYQIATQSVIFATMETIMTWVLSARQARCRLCEKNTKLYCAKCMVLLHLHYEQ